MIAKNLMHNGVILQQYVLFNRVKSFFYVKENTTSKNVRKHFMIL